MYPTTDFRPTSTIRRPTSFDPAPLTELGGFKLNLLFILSQLDEPRPSGREIHEAVQAQCPTDEVKHGRFYRNLSELAEDGYVDVRPIDGRTNGYKLTEETARRLHAHIRWEAQCLFGSTADAEGGA
ncbi:helix-turn-helix transcriptional regulator [Halobaculum limi]|uniref:helix-turn-helix transcriptional regulator n=1 Tax=Halobaculum limi TaxID=3031916 RepID=UPI00240587FD|nr:helix-turn-helix transcriptional regulator [Halobaculum sp. YSMS11]